MKENQYFYCIVHKKCLFPSDKKEHETEKCVFLIQETRWRKPKAKKKLWVARTIVEKEGMKIVKLPKIKKVEQGNLPKDAVLIDIPAFNSRRLG